MNRRIALKNLAFVAAGLMMLPGCDTSGWNKEAVKTANAFLSVDQEQLLAEMAETLVPATDTPGAKALGVQDYIQKIVADCYDQDVQTKFVNELDKVEQLSKQKFSKSFAEADADERAQLFEQLETSEEEDQQAFYALVKELTIRGYLTSEYVMKNLIKYEMVPGRYHGCVPVSSNNIS